MWTIRLVVFASFAFSAAGAPLVSVDSARGQLLFSSKHCSECHGINGPKSEDAKPVIRWESLGHPILLAEAMWNHAANMRQAFADQKLAWPEITGQDLSDMLVYLRNLPATRRFG